ncbi:hypothetical protein ACFQL4_17525 [Halosimplex aquaticum]
MEDLLASGAWTDDPVAAAVLDERVEPPRRSLRGRIRAWLFPERIVRRQAARAVAAIADAADEELPPVVGQRAPRTVPTLAPALGSLQRSVDGTLQRASASPSVDSAADASGEATGGDAIDTDADGDATDGDAPPDTDDGDAEVAELVGRCGTMRRRRVRWRGPWRRRSSSRSRACGTGAPRSCWPPRSRSSTWPTARSRPSTRPRRSRSSGRSTRRRRRPVAPSRSR